MLENRILKDALRLCVGILLILGILCLWACNHSQKPTTMNDVENFLSSQIKQNKTPSVQYYIFDVDSTIYSYKSGLTSIKHQLNISEKTTYRGCSTTKTFTALAILQLAEQNKLDIEQQAKLYLPDFPYSGDITIRQLLSHTAGIPGPNPLSWIHLEEEHETFDHHSFFRNQVFAKHDNVKSKPNEKFAYSNLGYFLLGQIIEATSGQPYEDFIRLNILESLELGPHELGFEISGSGMSQLATGYQKRMSGLNMLLGFFMDKSKFMGKPEGKWKPFNNYYINGAAYGGLIGRPTAYVKYIQELIKPDCGLIGADFKQMLFEENLTNDKKGTGMCLSWFQGLLNGVIYYCHAGGGGGYYCEIRIYPEKGIGSVIMFNRTGVKDERLLDKLDRHFIKN